MTTEQIDAAVAQYLETALWSSTDMDTEEPLDVSYDVSDFSLASIARAREIVSEFVAEAAELIERCDLDAEQVGHDLWLTQNRHGAGFWDRGLGLAGDALTDAAHGYGEMYLDTFDGIVSLEG